MFAIGKSLTGRAVDRAACLESDTVKKMATVPLVSVEEYLHTSYRPDCDYIDGVVVERNLGRFDHSTMQMLMLMALQSRANEWRVLVRPELRLRIRPGKYRVPDVMVLPAVVKHPPVIELPPLLCIEIVSPDDRLKDLIERAKDYRSLRVPETWILDPEEKQAHVYASGLHRVEPEAMLIRGDIELDFAALCAQL